LYNRYNEIQSDANKSCQTLLVSIDITSLSARSSEP